VRDRANRIVSAAGDVDPRVTAAFEGVFDQQRDVLLVLDDQDTVAWIHGVEDDRAGFPPHDGPVNCGLTACRAWTHEPPSCEHRGWTNPGNSMPSTLANWCAAPENLWQSAKVV
jgi:hypothetical protein